MNYILYGILDGETLPDEVISQAEGPVVFTFWYVVLLSIGGKENLFKYRTIWKTENF